MLSLRRRIFARGPVWETFAVAGFAFALLTPMHVEAELHRFDNPREMFMLPEYCKYTQEFRANVPGGNNPAEIARWTNLMGAVYIHMHHYCYGLMATIGRRSYPPRARNACTIWVFLSLNSTM